MANPYDENFGIGGGGDPNPYDEPAAQTVGTTDATAMGQRGLSKGQWFPEKAVNEDTTRTVASWPMRIASSVVGAPGDIDQLARNADAYFGFAPESKTKLPTSDSMFDTARSHAPPAVADWIFHKPQTTTGNIVGTTLDVVTPLPGIKGRGAYETAVQKAAPEAADLVKHVDRGYDILRQSGIGYHPQNYNAMVSGLNREIGNTNVSHEVRALVNNLDSGNMMGRLGNPVDAQELEGTYQQAGTLMGAVNGPTRNNDRRVLGMIRDRLDEFRKNSPVISGNMSGPQAMELLDKVRYDASRVIKERKLSDIANTAQYEANPGQYIRGQIRAILRNKNARATMSTDELQSLKRVVGTDGLLTGGGWVGRGARYGLGYALGGPIGAGVATAGEVAGRVLKARHTESALDFARSLMLAGPRMAPKRPVQDDANVVRALLSGSIGAGTLLD